MPWTQVVHPGIPDINFNMTSGLVSGVCGMDKFEQVHAWLSTPALEGFGLHAAMQPCLAAIFDW